MSTPFPFETIYALSTPPGVGALAVIRLSGSAVVQTLALLGVTKPLAPRLATLVRLRDPDQTDEVLDQALVTFFPGPASFTGEDVAEISLHGGRAVVAGVLRVLSTLPGLRLAEPGEFTKRAFLNHKIDLTEAEAVADLIHAETALQRRQALHQLDGALKNLYDHWRDELIHICAYLEAHLDFPDEDLPHDLMDRIHPRLKNILQNQADHLDDCGRGEILREGVRAVIIGPPNAGKSSLLNFLARREAALVSSVPGTTRDLIDVHLEVAGYPVVLTDTAGIRYYEGIQTGHEAIEAMGIDRAMARARAAQIKIAVFDGATLPDLDPHTLALVDEATLVVINKTDLAPPLPDQIAGHQPLAISVHDETGLDRLIAALTLRLAGIFGTDEGVYLTRHRHRAALTDCYTALQAAQTATLPELMAEDLRRAIQAMGRLTGRVDVEDLLDVIFRDFCIGK